MTVPHDVPAVRAPSLLSALGTLRQRGLRVSAARRQVLRGFLERPRLYWTGDFHDRLDVPARANLSRTLKRLPAG